MKYRIDTAELNCPGQRGPETAQTKTRSSVHGRTAVFWLSAITALLMILVACSGATPAPTEIAPEVAPEVAPPTPVPPVEQVNVNQPLVEATVTLNPPPPAVSDAPAGAPSATTVPAPTSQPAPTIAQPAPTIAPRTVLQLPNVADTVERVRPAVLSIVAEVIVRDRAGNPRSNFGSGTGVIITPDGLALTNNHVIEGAANITVTMDDGSQLEAELVGADRLTDLAVLRLPLGKYTFMPPDDSIKLRAGEWVIAIGNALALPGGPTVTVGVVSALGRTIGGAMGAPLYDLVQTDTVINPGNSGGPLISLAGELIGINTAVLRGGGGGGPPIEGIGFAINMETAVQVSQQLIADGRVKWAWMGVFLADLVPEMAMQLGLPIREGVVIQDVLPDGPSHEAGIQPGDIIMSMDGRDTATVTELTRLLRREFRAGQEIEVQLFRGGSRQTVRLILGEWPAR